MMDPELIVPGPRTKSALALAERHRRRVAQRDRGQRPAPEPAPLAAEPKTSARALPARVFAGTISEVGARLGLTHRAIRLYEEMGLITCARGPKNMRVLDAQAQARLQVVVDLKALGLTISEISDLLSNHLGDPQVLRGHIEARLELIDRQRAAIVDFLSRLPAPEASSSQGAQ